MIVPISLIVRTLGWNWGHAAPSLRSHARNLSVLLAGIILVGGVASPHTAQAQSTTVDLSSDTNTAGTSGPSRPSRGTGPIESVEADVSTRNVAVETDFTGVRIVVFGAINHSRATSAFDGYYDIAVLVEGPREDIVVRQKSHVAGIWVNTEAKPFKAVPSYYAILSTKPVEEIARPAVRNWLGVGFDNVKMLPATQFAEGELTTYRDAVIRLKQDVGLFTERPGSVQIIGSSLFRATVDLPANVSVGEFKLKVMLFHDGAFLDSYETELALEREGFERAVYRFAFDYPFWYGVVAVLVAVLAGLSATQIFRRD